MRVETTQFVAATQSPINRVTLNPLLKLWDLVFSSVKNRKESIKVWVWNQFGNGVE